ncbi:MAG: SUMF1/EgtB/PvdO family nonheme iron enzyme [Polyangiaceae bacterium]
MDYDLLPGQRVGSDYEVVRLIARGTTGPVYAAKQLSTGALRGLKIMLADYAADELARQRFVDEARLGAKIESDHIVQVVGAGIDPVLGRPWLAMELLEGVELTQAIVTRPQGFNSAETRDVFIQLCHAVGAAHEAGISHTDLRPENIFLAKSRHHQHPFMVKVLDFGIARVVLRGPGRAAAERSRAWMAPEQIPVNGVDTPAADVWALGLIAFYLLTGKSYWLYSAQAQALEQEVTSGAYAPASGRAAQIGARALPDGFDAWFARCVARDPSARFENANVCCASLMPILEAAAARAGETSAGFFSSLDRPSRSAPPPAGGPMSSLDRTPPMSHQVFMTTVGAQRESHGPGATLVGHDLMAGMFPPPGGPPSNASAGVAPSTGYSGTMLGFSAAPGSGAPQPQPQLGPYASTSGAYPGAYGPAGYPPVHASTSSVAIPQPPPQPSARSQKSSVLPIVATLGVLAAAGAGVGIYFATRAPEKTARDEPSTGRSTTKPTPPASNAEPKTARVAPTPPVVPTLAPKPEDRDAITGRMVKLDGGSFQMGLSSEPGESPVHSAFVGPFEMDVTEVTVKAYAACVSAGTCSPATDDIVWPDIGPLVRGYKPGCNMNSPTKQDHPVNCVSFTEAERFCGWANKRLPTEEEWEFAARGGVAGQRHPWGASAPDPSRANRCGMECAKLYAGMGFSANATYTADDHFEFTAPVGSFPAGSTPTGLADMEGNVWEWVSSPFCPYSTKACGDARKVIRGQSYDDYLPNLAAGPDRAPGQIGSKLPSIGFRCARGPSGSP